MHPERWREQGPAKPGNQRYAHGANSPGGYSSPEDVMFYFKALRGLFFCDANKKHKKESAICIYLHQNQ